jgi:hypothetical protein
MTSTISIAISVDGIGAAQGRPYLARLTTDTSTVTAAGLIAVFTVVHVCLAALIGLGVDESYSLTISRDLALSYFDHPPLHLWIAHFAQMLLGHGPIVRLPFVAMSAMSSWFMFQLTRELFGGRAGLWSLTVFNLSGFFLFAAGCWILPDGPLNLCMLGACLSALPILRAPQDCEPGPAPWIKTGVWIGLAFLSKYHAIIFALGLLAFLAASVTHRRLLVTPGPYLGMATSLLLSSPVLIWNAEHAWVSFAFQGSRAMPHAAPSIAHLIAQLAGEALLLLPWIIVPFAAAVRRSFRLAKFDDRHAFCLWLGAPLVVLCTLAPLWGSRGMPHWPMPGWLILYPLFGTFLADAEQSRVWPRNWLRASVMAAIAIAAVGGSDAATGWIGQMHRAGSSGFSPTIETLKWSQLRDTLADKGLLTRFHLVVIAPDWETAGKIDQAVGDHLPVYIHGPDARGFAFRKTDPIAQGEDALIIGRPVKLNTLAAAMLPHFRSVGWRSTVYLGRAGQREIALTIILVRHFLREDSKGDASIRWSEPGVSAP